jgi:hypothetical protein
MTAASTELRTWSPLKWSVVAACILALQMAFFFWFTLPPRPAPYGHAPGISIRMPDGQPADLPVSVSPLALARPDAHGFSGKAWLQIPPVTYDLQQSNPPPFRLPLQTGGLGGVIAEALSGSRSRPFETALRPGPRFDEVNYTPAPDPTTLQSTLTVEGELAGRPLLVKPVLKLQPADSILSNTVVYVMVDADGRVFAPPVLAPRGPKDPAGTAISADADADALVAAADLLFQPLARVPKPPRLTPGRLVFHWQTVPKPPPATNDTTASR